MKCNEAPEETPAVSEERLLQLSCFISQGRIFEIFFYTLKFLVFLDVKYLFTGLKNVSIYLCISIFLYS